MARRHYPAVPAQLGAVDQIRRWIAVPHPVDGHSIHWLANRHTKPYQRVHHLHASQDFAHLGVVAAQAQLRPDELLEPVHGGLGYRALVIAGVFLPLLQLTRLERRHRLIAAMTLFLRWPDSVERPSTSAEKSAISMPL